MRLQRKLGPFFITEILDIQSERHPGRRPIPNSHCFLNMNIVNLQDDAGQQDKYKEAGHYARPRNTLVGPPGFEPRTQGL